MNEHEHFGSGMRAWRAVSLTLICGLTAVALGQDTSVDTPASIRRLRRGFASLEQRVGGQMASYDEASEGIPAGFGQLRRFCVDASSALKPVKKQAARALEQLFLVEQGVLDASTLSGDESLQALEFRLQHLDAAVALCARGNSQPTTNELVLQMAASQGDSSEPARLRLSASLEADAVAYSPGLRGDAANSLRDAVDAEISASRLDSNEQFATRLGDFEDHLNHVDIPTLEDWSKERERFGAALELERARRDARTKAFRLAELGARRGNDVEEVVKTLFRDLASANYVRVEVTAGVGLVEAVAKAGSAIPSEATFKRGDRGGGILVSDASIPIRLDRREKRIIDALESARVVSRSNDANNLRSANQRVVDRLAGGRDPAWLATAPWYLKADYGGKERTSYWKERDGRKRRLLSGEVTAWIANVDSMMDDDTASLTTLTLGRSGDSVRAFIESVVVPAGSEAWGIDAEWRAAYAAQQVDAWARNAKATLARLRARHQEVVDLFNRLAYYHRVDGSGLIRLEEELRRRYEDELQEYGSVRDSALALATRIGEHQPADLEERGTSAETWALFHLEEEVSSTNLARPSVKDYPLEWQGDDRLGWRMDWPERFGPSDQMSRIGAYDRTSGMWRLKSGDGQLRRVGMLLLGADGDAPFLIDAHEVSLGEFKQQYERLGSSKSYALGAWWEATGEALEAATRDYIASRPDPLQVGRQLDATVRCGAAVWRALPLPIPSQALRVWGTVSRPALESPPEPLVFGVSYDVARDYAAVAFGAAGLSLPTRSQWIEFATSVVPTDAARREILAPLSRRATADLYRLPVALGLDWSGDLGVLSGLSEWCRPDEGNGGDPAVLGVSLFRPWTDVDGGALVWDEQAEDYFASSPRGIAFRVSERPPYHCAPAYGFRCALVLDQVGERTVARAASDGDGTIGESQ